MYVQGVVASQRFVKRGALIVWQSSPATFKIIIKYHYYEGRMNKNDKWNTLLCDLTRYITRL